MQLLSFIPAAILIAAATLIHADPSAVECWKANACPNGAWDYKANLGDKGTKFCSRIFSNPSEPRHEAFYPASAILAGSFATKDQCVQSFNAIVNKCSGESNGGSQVFSTHNTNDTRLVVSFGNCEVL